MFTVEERTGKVRDRDSVYILGDARKWTPYPLKRFSIDWLTVTFIKQILYLYVDGSHYQSSLRIVTIINNCLIGKTLGQGSCVASELLTSNRL